MNLHEYQAKQWFKAYGMPVPPSVVVSSVEEATLAMGQLQVSRCVVKAQVHAGGRGKAGGVKLVDTKADVEAVARNLLHQRLVTYQTDEKGQLVNHLLIEAPCNIQKEYYLGAVIDRASQRLVLMASQEGGVDIEKVAETQPERIHKVEIDPLLGVLPYQARYLGFQLALNPEQLKTFVPLVLALGKLCIEKEISLVEINPLVQTQDKGMLCLDGKIVVDENALFRHPDTRLLRDDTQDDPREIRAREWDLNYIPLEGDIACMVNGAGLAMATMDLIKLEGGEPANFLDVGGGATKERVTEAFKIILSDKQVKAILVNIFGGIVRCDLIAEGIISAVADMGIHVPVVVRLEGNRANEAADLLGKSGLNIIAVQSLKGAAQAAVQAAKGGKK